MIIRHEIPLQRSHYTKIDRYVFTDRRLTDGAKVLYGYVAGLKSGSNFSDKYIMKALAVSKAVLYRRKRELIDTGLILIDKIDMRTYVLYVGFSTCSAEQVKAQWIAEDDGE